MCLLAAGKVSSVSFKIYNLAALIQFSKYSLITTPFASILYLTFSISLIFERKWTTPSLLKSHWLHA